MNPQVQSFYDPATFTFTYVVYDRDGGRAAIVDPVLDYDPASARTSTASADRVLAFVREHGLTYSQFINLLNKKGITLDRKILADLAMNEPESFKQIVASVK